MFAWLISPGGQVLLGILAIVGFLGQFLGWWRAAWRFFRKPPVAPKTVPAPVQVVDEGETQSREVARQLFPILNDLGDHVGGLGHVMSLAPGVSDWEGRKEALDELFKEYEPLRERLHLLGNERLAGDIRKTVRTVRTDYLIRAKNEIERMNKRVSDAHDAGVVNWPQTTQSNTGLLLEDQGRNLKILAQEVRELHPPQEETPADTWTTTQLRGITDDYFRDRRAHCPVDDAELKIMRNHTGPKPKLVMVLCPNCGRKAQKVD